MTLSGVADSDARYALDVLVFGILGLALGFVLGVKGLGGVFSIRFRTSSSLEGFAMAMGIFPTRYRLPQKHCTEIGRIISRFAVLEAKLAKCAYVLLEIGPKEGRIAVRMGRIESAITVIQDLITAKNLTIRTNLNTIKAPFKKLELARDLVAHGVWVKHTADKEPVIQSVSGSYSETPGGPSIKAKIKPQGVKVTVQNLRTTVRHIDDAVRIVDAIGVQIDAARMLQSKHAKSPAQPAQGTGTGPQTKTGQ